MPSTNHWKGGQRQVTRGLASRGIWATAQELAGHLKEHIHTDTPEQELARRGAEAAARLLTQIAEDPEVEAAVRKRMEDLLDRWSSRSERDRKVIGRVQ